MSTAPQKTSGLLLWSNGLFVAGGITWIATITLTLLDVCLNDRLPNTIVISVAALAMSMTMCGVTFLLVDKQRRYLLDAWAEFRDEVVEAIRAARREASADIDAARRDLKRDTGSIPVITDKMLEFPTIGDALAAVAQLAGEVQQVRESTEQVVQSHQRLIAEREGLRRALAEAQQDRKLSPSEYYAVYSDAVNDLGDVGGESADD